MASYKVPQDVEADDKLLGPFSFRQFIYLIVVAGAAAIAWVLSQIFIGLAILPLPIIILFGALALPLRKDQPMEAYLAAMISFYFLKTRKRMWDPDGQQALVEITAPRKVEEHLTKDITEDEAEKRFSYLASVVDTQGWAVRGVASAPAADSSPLNPAYYNEAQQAEDILDNSNAEYNQINDKLGQAAAKHREELMERMHQPQAASEQAYVQQAQPMAAPGPIYNDPYSSLGATQPQSQDNTTATPHLNMNPYPNMHQSVIQPMGTQPSQPQPQNNPQSTSDTQPSPDIINLANNSDLSVETIAHEAQRLKKKHELPKDEVVVSLH